MQRSNFKSRGTMGKRPAKPFFNRLADARKRGQYSPRYLASLKAKESGYVDLAVANYAFDLTGSVTLLATVAQGASVNQRVGKKLQWKSLQCRGLVSNNATATVNDCTLLVVYDKRPTGALPAVTDILVSAASYAMNNDANSGRFQILKRQDWIMVGPSTAPSLDGFAKSADFFLDLKMKVGVMKAAGTGAITDIEEGALYLVTVGSQAAGTAAATSTIAFRTRFVDF